MSKRLIALCSVAVSTIYGAGYFTTKNENNFVQAKPVHSKKPAQKRTKTKITHQITKPEKILMEYGSSGNSVAQMQGQLITLGLLANGEQTGYFGPLTKAAVQAFQKEKNMSQTGKVDATFLNLLQRAVSTPPKKTQNSNSPYKDGVYTGTGANGYGDLSVSVTIRHGQITGVQITNYQMHYPSYYIDPQMADEVIQAQNSNVNIVTGATASSDNYVQAVAQALQTAKK